MRRFRKRDPSARYYGMMEQDDGIQRCPMCNSPVKMPDGITRSPIDRQLYHIDCILKDYWKMKEEL